MGMIGFLSGTVRGTGKNVCVVVNGVGYTVSVVPEVCDGENVELLITTVVRENAISLFGFSTATEQSLFDALVAVHGVGPSMAVAVLRRLGAPGLVTAVRSKDSGALVKVQGVGRKTADNIVAMIKLDHIEIEEDTQEVLSGSEVVAALEGLGFSSEKASAAVHALIAEGVDDEGELLRGALARLR